MKTREKVELVSLVLEKLAQGRYSYDHDGDGEIVRIQTYGPTHEEMEEFFSNELAALDALRDSIAEVEPDNPVACQLVEESWNDFWTKEFLRAVFTPPADAGFYEPLKGLSYEEVVSHVYDILNERVSEVFRKAVFEREHVTPEEARSRAALLTRDFLSGTPEILVDAYARRLAAQFPKMIRRAEKLEPLIAFKEVPKEIQDYLVEASKCYIAGQVIASVLVCRSIIQFAITDLLLKAGKKREIEQFDSDGKLTLESLSRRTPATTTPSKGVRVAFWLCAEPRAGGADRTGPAVFHILWTRRL
jgi:hypothetical protein